MCVWGGVHVCACVGVGVGVHVCMKRRTQVLCGVPLLSWCRVSEVDFWRNYFYRISLIKQSVQISTSNKGNL